MFCFDIVFLLGPPRPSGVHVEDRKSRSLTIKWDQPTTDQGVVQHLVQYKLR